MRATAMLLNKRFSEENNDQILHCLENVNHSSYFLKFLFQIFPCVPEFVFRDSDKQSK